MEKIFILYEQSLQLKELGFNELCIRGWYEDESLYYHPDSDIILDNPTFSQAFRFFREKYSLYNQGYSFNKGDFHYRIYKMKNNDDIPVFSTIVDLKKYPKSYEEAELECLKKLIEIVKNETL